jgi:hypothetical protein
MPLADPLSDPDSMALLADVPAEARRAAQAGGLEPLLVALLREKNKTGDELTFSILAMRQELVMRLDAFHTQLAGAAFEVNCTARQIGDINAELDERDRKRQFTLAVTSLIIGALTGIAAGVVAIADEDTHATDYVGIAGATLTGGVGALALYRRDPAVELEHEHNLLAPIWKGSDPDHLYSSFIFRMLMVPDRSEHGSPRNEVVAAWKSQLEQAHVPSQEDAQRILYGSGGVYSSELIAVRQKNFTVLEATLASVARDLELLDRFVVRAFFGSPANVLTPR